MKNSWLLLAFFASSNLSAQTPSVGDKITITIHANIDPRTTAPTWLGRLKGGANILGNKDAYRLMAEAESVSAGHAWISLKHGATCNTYGLFDGGPAVDRERAYGTAIQRSMEISPAQLSVLQSALRARSDYQWTGYYNCASYASEIWKEVTGELINPVPVGTYYVDSSGDRHEIKKNVRLKPLPPSPLGIVQEIIRLSNGSPVVSNSKTVCP